MSVFLYITVCIFWCSLNAKAQNDPIVQLPYGTLQGLNEQTLTGKPYYTFHKIPYAAPLIGPLRFKPPTPPIPWTGIRNAQVYDTICYQYGVNGPMESEDCLFLNVYSPSLPRDGKPPLPVMVFIHGGGFLLGSVPPYLYGPKYLVDQDVILVTCNYRLALFGFLSTLDKVLPGNYGLQDQQFALKWTKQFISYFGGDPDKIMLFGESAGSASVSYQLLNPQSDGLYRAAIMESGSSLDPWAMQRDAKDIAFATASYLNPIFLFYRNSQYLANYLRTVDAKILNSASILYAVFNNFVSTNPLRELTQGFVWAPVVHDYSFITEKMYVAFKQGHFNKVPVMMTINSEEALWGAAILPVLEFMSVNYDLNPTLLVPDDMGIQNYIQKVSMGLAIRDIYTQGSPFSINPGAAIRFLSDAAITKGVIKQAELQGQQEGSTVYFGQFSYRGLIGGGVISVPDAEDVGHAEELRYLFSTPIPNFNNPLLDKPDLDMQNLMVKMWTDFAKTTNPTPPGSPLPFVWPSLNSESSSDFLYLDIDKTCTIQNHPKNDAYPKWVALYQTVPNYDNFDTY